MLLTLFNIVYVLIAVAMIILILLQRGSGAQAGSGFGGGASGTVFGARGAATFLSRSTGILAALFFVLSLAMAWYLGHVGGASVRPADDLGVMSGVETPAAPKTPTAPTPSANGDVPAAPAAGTDTKPATDVPPATTGAAPAVATTPPATATPAPAPATTPAPAAATPAKAADHKDAGQKKPADPKKN